MNSFNIGFTGSWIRRGSYRYIFKNNPDRKIEGYWGWLDDTRYPMPVPNVLDMVERMKVYELIKEKQKHAKQKAYKGSSKSRIDGSRLGSTEYYTNEFLWPCDFASHYVLLHGVKPTDEFLKYIGYSI